MNIKFLAKIGIITGTLIIGAYILFLLLPFVLNFFIDKYTPQIAGEINKLTGLSSGLSEIKIVTTPKLTMGLKVKKFELYTPQKEPIIAADNFAIKMSLLPIFSKNIRVDVIQADKTDITLKFNKDGELDLIQYLPKNESENTDSEKESLSDNTQKNSYLPFGLKLSNHLPDIHLGGYNVIITDGKDNYKIAGNKTDVTDFIINKSIKIKTSGKVTLKEREHFNYNVNLFNKIMPDTDLNEMIFNPKTAEKVEEPEKVDVINILKGLYDYKVTADADINLITKNDDITGFTKISNISIIDLPPSLANLDFKGKTIKVNSDIYTAPKEVTSLNGEVTTGKNTFIDVNVKSALELANTINIVKKAALIFNIKDLQTLSASGKINADFNIKSDLKKVFSSGYLKIPYANMFYGLYNVGLDNINTDIALNDNNVKINNISFNILGQPLKIYGTLSQNAEADIHAVADKLSLKGLLVAIGQASIMKENPIYSGTISMDAMIKGKLDKINPVVKLNIANIDLKNIPSDIRLNAPLTVVNITSDGTSFAGNAKSENVKLINPALTVSAPVINANIKPEYIEVTKTQVKIDNNNTTISGKINNYLTEKIGLDFVSEGDIKSVLKGDLNIVKQTLNLVYETTDLSKIVVPMFDKSKMSFKGKINITGSMMNPIITGSAKIPSITIPEIPVTMTDMDIKLFGTILHGSGTVKEFASGGIKAENLTSDFELKGNEFYLNSLKGTAFDGKVSGNILYNISNAKTKISFKGSGLNAEKAIEGAAGIKNALSGTLGFNTDLTLTVLDYNDMIKSMKGKLNFDINKGAFGTIGRFEGFLGAANITQNYFLKNTVNALSNAAGLATAAQFNILDGSMTFSDGWANLNPIKSAGQSLCYYITGKYNILNGTTNVIILGRLDAPMVSKLGVLGNLNMSSILGEKAASVLKVLTSDPATEKTDKIPALTNGSTNYQEFKVNFNGGVDSKGSIKSFKWLKNADMSEYKPQSITDTVKTVKEAYKTDIKTTKEEINNTIETKKKEIQEAKEQINATKEDFKNLWKSIKETTKQTTPAQTSAPEVPPVSETKTTDTVQPAQTQKTETVQETPVQKSAQNSETAETTEAESQ